MDVRPTPRRQCSAQRWRGPRRVAVLVAVAAVVAAALPASAVGGRPSVEDRRERFEVLREQLQLGSLPDGLGSGTCAEVRIADLAGEVVADTTSCEGDALPQPPAGQGAPRLEPVAVVQTPSGVMALAELPGADAGTYVRVYANGDVAATAADGEVLWNHPSRSFIHRSGVGFPHPGGVAHVYLGVDPVDPFAKAAEDPFVVGDLTGDGVADVAIAHFVPAGSRMPDDWSGLVSVIDGRTGAVAWDHLYPGFIMNMAIVGRTLVVGVETGEPQAPWYAGDPGSRSHLAAWRFDGAGDALRATPAWSLEADPWARWLSVEAVPGDRIAASWTTTPVGTASGSRGEVLVAAVADGEVMWAEPAAGYPRTLRVDPGGDQLVVLEQDDPIVEEHPGYAIVARGLDDGAPGTSVRRDAAMALAFEVADLPTGAGAEWLVADVETTAAGTCAVPDVCISGGVMTAARVTAFDGASGAESWVHTLPAEPEVMRLLAVPLPYGLLVQQVEGRSVVVVGSLMPGEDDTQLQGLDGATGAVAWERREPNLLLPLFLAPVELEDQPAILTATSRPNVYGAAVATYVDPSGTGLLPIHPDLPYQVVSAWDSSTGRQLARTPMLGDVYAATGVHVDDDEVTDLAVGGESGGVFALDGAQLDDNPGVLWRTPVSGQVRQIHATDLDGDGHLELVVAASHSVDVLDSRTGAVRWSLPYPDDFIWTVAVGDVDGDALPDVVVPARGMDAHRGTDGQRLWRFAPAGPGVPHFSTSVITDDQRVVTQYLLQPVEAAAPAPDPGARVAPANQQATVLDGRTGQPLWTQTRRDPRAAPNLWKGVVVGEVPGVEGTAAAFTWDESLPDLAWRARTDVYALDTGLHAFSATTPEPGTNFGTTLVPGEALLQYNFGTSITATPEGPIPWTMWGLPTDVDVATTAGGPAVAATQWPSTVRMFGASEATSRTPAPTSWSENLTVGEVAMQDTDGDGIDEAIAFPFDWAGYAGSQIHAGRHSFSLDITSHALVVLRQVP